ncbi:MAG: 2OG-Fe(II) oxygenase [Pseudomonadota bacterium]
MNNIAPLRGFEQLPAYQVVHAFLGDELIQRLLAYAEANQEAFSPTQVAGRGRRGVNADIRTSSILRDFGPLKEELESRFRSALDAAVRELRMSPINLARLELALVVHGDGAFYRRHIDTMTDLPDANSDRALTGVYYFHDTPKGFSGGALRLFSILPEENGGSSVDIEPDRDMLLLFPSWVPHEVRPVFCSSGDFLKGRFAINCWYRSRRPSSVKVPAAFDINPLTDVVVRQLNDTTQIDISAYSAKRSFFQQTLATHRSSCFEAAMRLLNTETGNFAVSDLTSAEKLDLWEAGLLIGADESTKPFVSEVTDTPYDSFAANGFTRVAGCVTPAALSALLSYYRSAFNNGKLGRSAGDADRFTAHNDAAGRVMQCALLKTVERIVGNPIKGSYTYASLYCGGTDLPVHKDRPQCQYTVSILMDHQPASADGRSPWPIHLYVKSDVYPEEFFLALGDGFLFRGGEIAHGRPRLPENETCWVLLLHYVDADFEGALG